MTGGRPGRAGPLVAGLVLGLGALVGAGCGLPTQSGPQVIPHSQVPLGILSASPPHSPTTSLPTSVLAAVQIYLVGTNQAPVAVHRYEPVRASLLSILDALMEGPTTVEASTGYTTAIPAQTRVLSAKPSTTGTGTVVTVDFTSVFGQVSGSAQITAVEQVVLTVVSQEGPATGVVFEIDGHPIDVPTADGVQVTGPVYVLDFIPKVTPTPPTTAAPPAP